jgi:hypothetical protein
VSTLDCFAAMENHQLKHYVSWNPDPYSMYPDLFSRIFLALAHGQRLKDNSVVSNDRDETHQGTNLCFVA